MLLGGDAVGGSASQDELVLLVHADLAGCCGILTDPAFVHPNDPQTQTAAQANKMDLVRLTKGVPILPHT